MDILLKYTLVPVYIVGHIHWIFILSSHAAYTYYVEILEIIQAITGIYIEIITRADRHATIFKMKK